MSGLKKVASLALSVDAKRALIDPHHLALSLRRQCDLLGLNRASWYHVPALAQDSNEDAAHMRLIDEEYTRHPFYGSRKLVVWLRRQRYRVNRKRVQRLMRALGLQDVAPGPATSQAHPAHTIYPYLLQAVAIEQIDHVWCNDITYIRLRHGFVYLVAIKDVYSRLVLSWQLSTTMEAAFCTEALQQALGLRTPAIFNTDQGNQFTSHQFISTLQQHGVAISMDGKGRCCDDVVYCMSTR
ncbi:MAG: IS3 family transposase [Candidatus Competibacteraceae bacterium]|nr:IS3 family transposase [Candidatus Competibacteraceae bacterium]